MTCIVGIEYGGNVYIGGDSSASAGSNIQRTALSKVFRRGKFLIGYTTSFRMGQLLQYSLDVPDQYGDQDDMDFMATRFVDAVRDCFKVGGFASEDNSREEGGSFLVGYNSSLYELASDYQVNRYIDKYAAIGGGYQYALGSLFESSGRPEERVNLALRAAAHSSQVVCGPFYIGSLIGEDK